MSAAPIDIALQMRLLNGAFRQDITSARGLLATLGAAVGLSTGAFQKFDRAGQGLRSALAATGNEVEGNLKRFNSFAQSVRASTTYTTAFVNELQTMALNLGVSTDQVNEAVKAGIGLGTAVMNGDMKRGVRAAALAIQGQSGELGELIPKLRAAKTEAQKLAVINKIASAGWLEAQSRAKTFSGSIELMRRSFIEAGASIGQAFAPEIQKAAGLVQAVAEKVSGMTDAQRAALVTQTELAAGAAASAVVLGKVGSVMTGLRGVFGAATRFIGPVGFALAAVGKLFVDLVGKGETFGERLNDVFTKIGKKVGEVADWIGNKWESVTDGIVFAYFKALELMGGAPAAKVFEQYRKDVDAATAAAAANQKANAKKGVDDTVALHKEGAREIKATFKSINAAHQDLQVAIFKGAQATVQKQKDAAKASTGAAAGTGGSIGNALANVGRAANPAAQYRYLEGQERALIAEQKRLGMFSTDKTQEPGMMFSDDPERVRQNDRKLRDIAKQKAVLLQQMAKEQTTIAPTASPQVLAGRVTAAKKEITSIDQKLANLTALDSTDASDEAVARRRSTQRELEARKHALEGLITRGGADVPYRPNSTDVTTPLKEAFKEAREQGVPDSFERQQHERDLDERIRKARGDKTMREAIQTPESEADRQASKVWLEAGKDMKDAAEKINAAKVIGVVSE